MDILSPGGCHDFMTLLPAKFNGTASASAVGLYSYTFNEAYMCNAGLL